MRAIILSLLFVTTFVGVTPAGAADFIVQDDPAIMDDSTRAATLDRMVEIGATHVRVMVQHERTNPDARFDVFIGRGARPALATYIPAFRDIVARGLRVYANLSWYGEGDPAAIARWARRAAAVLGPYVDTWSILNEPDITLPDEPCTPAQARAAVARRVVEIRRVRRNIHLRRVFRNRNGRRLVRRGARYRKVVRLGRKNPRGERRKLVRFKRHRRGTHVRRIRITVVSGTVLEPISVQTACTQITRADTYSRILAAVAPAIDAHDPTARKVAGELSPCPGASTMAAAVDWSPVDAIAIHPYFGHDKDFGMDNIKGIQRSLPKPTVISEFGVHPGPWQVSELKRAWQLAAEAGLTPAQYTLYGYGSHGGWNTSVLPDHAALTSPAYEAIRRMRRER